ncbi:MAG: SBBP repeat-containing protein, partial [Candidatus Marinimicrobia bacterium]|nr:SBBP repeat-containing protein [Candidatus Neomarinimicrobiota bacterium]
MLKYNSSGTKQWTTQLGSSGRDSANAIAIDSSGNLYLAGITYGGLDLHTNSGTNDFFVVKYNSSGTRQWTQQLGTPSTEGANAVATDSSGNVYVVGSTYGLLGHKKFGGSDLFVVKYNSSGTWQWTKQNGSGAWDEARGVATDSSGNVYVVGGSKGGSINGVYIGYNMTEIFVIKYKSSGEMLWTKVLGTWKKDFANAVDIDSSGNIYVAGATERDLVAECKKHKDECDKFGGGDDLFVVKYDSKGEKKWTKQLWTKRNDRATGVATDSSGNVYVTGYTYWKLDGNTHAGYNDAFVVKYLDNGTKLWTKQFGTPSSDLADGIATDSSGNVYVVGYTYGDLDGNTNTGASDIFVVKYNSSGTKQWTQQLGSSMWY